MGLTVYNLFFFLTSALLNFHCFSLFWILKTTGTCCFHAMLTWFSELQSLAETNCLADRQD